MEPSSFRLPLTSLCDLPLLFGKFQVKTGSGTWIMSTSSLSSVVPVSNVVLGSSSLLDDVLFCLLFLWCPCMAIDISVQYNGGFLPDIILLTQCYLHYYWGTRLNAMKRFFVFAAFDTTY